MRDALHCLSKARQAADRGDWLTCTLLQVEAAARLGDVLHVRHGLVMKGDNPLYGGLARVCGVQAKSILRPDCGLPERWEGPPLLVETC